MHSPISIVTSYARQDVAYRQMLDAHLVPLRRSGLITIWNDAMIPPGGLWHDEITKAFESASIILLLVSSDFLKSEYCYHFEFAKAFVRHQEGNARIIPIIVRSCCWRETPIGDLQALPANSIDISSSSNQDATFAEIAMAIGKVARTILSPITSTTSDGMHIRRIHRRAMQRDQHCCESLDCATVIHQNLPMRVETVARDSLSTISIAHPEAQQMPEASPAIQSFLDGINNLALPVPFYVTHLHSGQIVFANQPLCDIFGCELNDLLQMNATTLYADQNVRDRIRWVHDLTHAPQQCLDTQIRYRTASRSVLVAREISRIVNPGEANRYAAGVLIDVSKESQRLLQLQSRCEAYERILDLECIKTGVYRLDRAEDGKCIVSFINSYGRRLLGLKPDTPCSAVDLKQLPPLSEQREFLDRVDGKLKGDPLDQNEHRHLSRADGHGSVPVQIYEFGDRNSDGTRVEILAAYHDVRLPPDVQDLLHNFGPNNPLLERVGMATFEKIYRNEWVDQGSPAVHTDDGDPFDLLFTQGNRVFVGELIEDGKIAAPQDLAGKRDQELFPSESAEYNHVDHTVIARMESDHRIERHTAGFVQVYKTPVFKANVDGEARKSIGIHAYYWRIEDTDRIVDELRRMYDPWRLLNDIPVPVFAKDEERRIIYCNQRFVDDIREVSARSEIVAADIIGKRDEDIHDPEKANQYRSDDSLILELPVGKSRVWRERHGRDNRLVEVRKSRIEGGLLGSFVFVDEWKAHVNSIWINWRDLTVHAGEDVLAHAEPAQRDRLLLLEKLLDAFGGTVSYHHFADVSAPTSELERKSILQKAFQRKHRLEEFLKMHGLDSRIVVETEKNEGYYVRNKTTVVK